MKPDTEFVVARDHPAIPGHFPDNPVVPGVLVLAHVQAALAALLAPRRGALRLTAIPQTKFLAPLAPGELCTIAFPRISEEGAHLAAHFECRSRARVIARGILRFEASAGSRD
jgi:3-hydroxymyristoyl/3-hydroxydecanoyl-(acyl carrier protein) dehydratase